MPTALFAKARTAGLLALTLVIAASAAYPAQAARLLIEKAPIDMGSGSGSDHQDCDSRRDVKFYFQDYGLKHVKVSKTHDYYVYKVTGFAQPSAKEAALSQDFSQSDFPSDRLSKFDYVRYVFLFDACDHRIVEQLQPRKTLEMM